MKFNPHDYQQYTIDKIIQTPKIACILDMGLGKTVCTLTALEDLMFNHLEVERVLVIAPLKVADMTWPDELQKWDHLKYIRISRVIGSEEKRIQALNRDADIYCINRENTKWIVDYFMQKKEWPFDTIVIDESSSFKNNQSQRFKALRKVARLVKRMILLTGTPAPNSLMELWPQIYLLDQGKRLGRTITEYRRIYFTEGRRNQNIVYEYIPRRGAEKEIYRRISDVAVSLKAADHLKMPERVENYIRLRMDPKTKKTYDIMERDYLLEIDDETITAASAGVVCNKLLQMANGAVYSNDKTVVHIHDLKLEALKEIIEDNEGKPIMVFYNFQHDYNRLMEYFKDMNPRTLNDHKDKEEWDAGKIQLLLAHPASMGHGLNLQAGGHIIVWFSLTYSLELYQQANARLYRQGQTESVIINHLIVEGTADENAVAKLKKKGQTQDELIEAVKARIKRAKCQQK